MGRLRARLHPRQGVPRRRPHLQGVGRRGRRDAPLRQPRARRLRGRLGRRVVHPQGGRHRARGGVHDRARLPGRPAGRPLLRRLRGARCGRPGARPARPGLDRGPGRAWPRRAQLRRPRRPGPGRGRGRVARRRSSAHAPPFVRRGRPRRRPPSAHPQPRRPAAGDALPDRQDRRHLHAGDIFRAAPHPRSFVSLEGSDHLLTAPGQARRAARIISAWANQYLAED